MKLQGRIICAATLLTLAGMLLAARAWSPSAEATLSDPPQTVSPPDGASISTLGPTLEWSNPAGTTQYQLQVVPANNDGPGINLIRGGSEGSFAVPAPPQWYGLLPD